jgi:hypothetical protein
LASDVVAGCTLFHINATITALQYDGIRRVFHFIYLSRPIKRLVSLIDLYDIQDDGVPYDDALIGQNDRMMIFNPLCTVSDFCETNIKLSSHLGTQNGREFVLSDLHSVPSCLQMFKTLRMAL